VFLRLSIRQQIGEATKGPELPNITVYSTDSPPMVETSSSMMNDFRVPTSPRPMHLE
jgi:hypothetical protein